jgi:protein TonB
MWSYAHPAPGQQPLGRAVIWAIALHCALAASLVIYGLLHAGSSHWGEDASAVGAIQASMVSAIPLPPRAAPVEKSVLTSENVSKAPAPTPKEKTAPPPKPTDILVKEPAKTPPKVAAKESPEPPRHPQPVPETPKAATGDAATQIPQSITHLQNGMAAVTVQDRTFGTRYAWYINLIGRKVAQNWDQAAPDPSASQGKKVTMLFQVDRDGSISNIRTENRSGSPTLDDSALRALQRIDGFGPLPAGDHIVVAYTFGYQRP